MCKCYDLKSQVQKLIKVYSKFLWVNSYYTWATIKLGTHSPNSSSEYICIYTCMYVCKLEYQWQKKNLCSTQ